MITFKRLGSYGKLGNQLFEVAAIVNLSKKYHNQFILPRWQYSSVFKYDFNDVGVPEKHWVELSESNFGYSESDFSRLADGGDYNITAWLQSYKYHDTVSPKTIFEFDDAFLKAQKDKWQKLFTKPTIAISVRRGDYVGNPNYELLPIDYYFGALVKHFPDYYDYNIVVFSDDYDYCRIHFDCLGDRVTYIKDEPIAQLALMTLCDNHIIANSTFSYWGAYLSDSKKIIRPARIFAGPLKDNPIQDHYPPEWITYDYLSEKIQLPDVTFCIPVKFDSNDRKQNLDLCVCMIKRSFDVELIVSECMTSDFGYMADHAKYIHYDYSEFHRTKMINEMVRESQTPIVVNYDCDVFTSPVQIYESIRLIRENKADFVYPYDGRFARVPREHYNNLTSFLDVGYFARMQFRGMMPNSMTSVGGAVVMNKQSFISAGMENENFISYGAEDLERVERWKKIGYVVERVPGIIYHIDHKLLIDSSTRQPHFVSNEEEFHKVEGMSRSTLFDYMSTWKWLDKYTAEFYAEIGGGSRKSAEAIMPLVYDIISVKSVLDVGGGNGDWCVGDVDYTMVDGYWTEKPAKGTLIRHNLDIMLDLEKKFDLVICLEVIEHLQPKFEDVLIDTLCRHGDNILFSGAIPGQGGNNHLNERWQSHWIDKFIDRGYGWFDIRGWFWNGNEVEVWYRQNMLFFSKGDVDYDMLPSPITADVVHPQMFTNHVKK